MKPIKTFFFFTKSIKSIGISRRLFFDIRFITCACEMLETNASPLYSNDSRLYN